MKFWQSQSTPQCKLSQQDLLDMSEQITHAYAPHNSQQSPELVLMPVDPRTLYAYWVLGGEANLIEETLVLKVFSVPELSEQTIHPRLSFEITVSGMRNQQKIALPIAATAYAATIAALNADESHSILASAEAIQVPREAPVVEHACVDKPLKLATPDNSQPLMPITSIGAHYVISEPATQLEPYLIKNFNNYGYDLSIHPQTAEGDAHFRANLESLDLQQTSRMPVHLTADTQQSTDHKTASAQGLLR